ncbi:oligosaccharide flippase family protein [Pelagovum pacificum]|uniref:Lipopolysaccharide biosynthesis protein n=1 Tax=Pelagovum pacificum TaxID=2588711 RepID=A0A5C5G9I0_9RHOB|nr:oligosaccharide flippase family protein [Pelagovum pacificum]QQA41921.1 oligosaccharide flippase family protein [Pelagovum pacificum]TNY30640.1 hypothetical protein FHY64_18840 [Pelagovum pacificum]
MTAIDHVPRRGRAAARGMVWSLGQNALTTLVTLLVFAVTSRTLGAEAFGRVALATSLMTFALAAAPVAFAEALVQADRLTDRQLDALFWCAGAAGMVLYLAVCAVAMVVADRTTLPEIAWLTPVIASRVLFECFAIVPTGLLQRRMAFRTLALRQLAGVLAGNGLCLLLVLGGGGIWALALNGPATSLAGLLVLAAGAGWRPSGLASPGHLKSVARFGGFASAVRALSILRLDQLVLGLFAGPVALGAFYFANRIVQIGSGPAWGALGPVTHALLSRCRGSPPQLREGYLSAAFAATTLAVPLFGGLWLVAPIAVPNLFGTQWSEAVPVLRALCLTGALGCFGAVNGASLSAQGRVGAWFAYQSALQALRLVVLVLLLPQGIGTATMGYALAGAVLWPVATTLAARACGVSISRLFKAVAAPLLAGAAALLMSSVGVAAAAVAFVTVLTVAGWPRLGEMLRSLRSQG